MSKMELEDYACEYCRNDGFVYVGCGDCPHNNARIQEYYRKYGKKGDNKDNNPCRRGIIAY